MSASIPLPGTYHHVCNLCEAMCGINVKVGAPDENGRPSVKILPDNKDPFSQGALCPKASALEFFQFDPSKLRHPVMKIEGQWQPITWKEAYATVANRLRGIRRKYGSDAIASYLGNPIVHNLGMMVFIHTLLKAIDSKNVYSATSMDQLPHHFVAYYMFGHAMRIPVPDIDRTDYFLMMGANPKASNGSIMSSAGISARLRDLEQRDGKLVLIDPRRTETAKVAAEHHFITPGTDLYFLLSFLHIIFRDDRYRLGKLEKHLQGFEELPSLFEDFSPEQVAPITKIPSGTTERIVDEFLSHFNSVVYGRMGLSTQEHGGLCQWLIILINLVTGNLDSPGGLMFPSPAIEIVSGRIHNNKHDRWRSRVRGLKEFSGELPVSTLAEEISTEGDGQIKALVTVCGNPVLSSPGGHRLDRALEGIDFMVSIDNYINETTRHADIILPTPSGLEIDHYDLVFNALAVSNNAKFSEAVFPVGKDRPLDWQVLKELSRRVSPRGLSLVERLTTPRRLVNWALMLGPYGKLSSPKRWFNGLSLKKPINSKHGISLGPLEPRIPQCLTTPDRKIHLAPKAFLDRLAEVKENDYPQLLQSSLLPRKNHSFTLIGRRILSSNNSWLHQVEKLRRNKQVRCTVLMHPQDAEKINLVDGQNVTVQSRVGTITLPVEITATMMPGVLSIPHGFGHHRAGTKIPHAEADPGVSVNDITDPGRIDELTGNAAFSGQPVEVRKAAL